MNVLLLTSHSIAEHDDLDMFTRMRVPTFSIGAYTDPSHPTDDKRPAIPDAIHFETLQAATDEQRARMERDYGDPGPVIDWGKARLAPEVVDWADTVIVHHFPEAWIGGNWDALDGKRVIWRTCGQSDPRLELAMARFRLRGLQIVRYSPKEREAFSRLGAFAGEDALIRFGKDPDEWQGWTGEDQVVGNITQHMAQRGDACGHRFWTEATEGLPVMPAGPGSEALRGGIGALDYDAMRAYLRRVRAYLYTGTRPASYTLGWIEAAMTGTPILSIGQDDFACGGLLETCELGSWADAKGANDYLRMLLGDPGEPPSDLARDISRWFRAKAVELFGLDGVMARWAEFLGVAA